MAAQMTSKLHVCIDCGGSKTVAVISTLSSEGEAIVAARGTSGPSNYKDNGVHIFLSAIRTAVQSALSKVLGRSVELPVVDDILKERNPINSESQKSSNLYSAWIGASGIDATQDIRTLEPLLSRLLSVPLTSQRLIVANDSYILCSPLLSCPAPIENAIVAIAGTGSVVVSFRRESGSTDDGTKSIIQLARAGGWGHLLGDDGSGFFAGREAIREVLREFNLEELEGHTSSSSSSDDTRKETLRSLLLSHFGLDSPDELFSVIYAPDSTSAAPSDGGGKKPEWAQVDRKQRFVSLAPLVFHAAFKLKDDTALRALRTSVSGLAAQILSLCRRESDPQTNVGRRVAVNTTVLCLGGSLFGVGDYRDLLLEELSSIGLCFPHVVFVSDAAQEGALGLAKLFG
ncbi:hypothetical protein FRC17_004036 [Serendipita sp. 399]|nr:hypothetical protein FRC17_004036 [Serendipita sp. 399]